MKFLDWLNSKRKPVGYTLGGLNVLLGISYALQGNQGLATLWIVIGLMFAYDAYDSK